jgi:chemotaxis protein MotA
MGATLGMISLLRTVATVEGQKNVGPAMAVALVGTLYGIAFANLVLLPVGEQLIDSARELQIKNRIIVEGLKLIASRQNPVILAEELNSFLLAGERINWRKIKKTKTDQNSKAA